MSMSFTEASPVDMFKELEHLFLDIDSNKNGALSAGELAELLRCIHKSEGISRPKAKLKEEVQQCMQMVQKSNGDGTLQKEMEFIPFVEMIARTKLLKRLDDAAKTELLSIAKQVDPTGKNSRIVAPGGVVWGLGMRAIARRAAWVSERETRKLPAGEKIRALCGVFLARLRLRHLEEQLLAEHKAEAGELVRYLREEFAKHDVDQSGVLDYEEVTKLLVARYRVGGKERSSYLNYDNLHMISYEP